MLVIAAVLAVLVIVQAYPPNNNEEPQGPQGPQIHEIPQDPQGPNGRPRPIPQQPNQGIPANPEIQPVLLNGEQQYHAGNDFGTGNAFIEGYHPAEESSEGSK